VAAMRTAALRIFPHMGTEDEGCQEFGGIGEGERSGLAGVFARKICGRWMRLRSGIYA
jgi:hypothetical protein